MPLCPLCENSESSRLVQRADKRWILACKRCGHAYLDPSKGFDWLAAIYAGYFSEEEAACRRQLDGWFSDETGYHQITLRWLKSQPWLKPGLRVLELGCGPGHVLAALKAGGCEVTGVDSNTTALALAKKWFGLDLIQGDVSDVSSGLPENSFDLVLAFEVIEHVVEPRDLVKKVVPLLKPGGYFILSTPNFTFYERVGRGYPDLSERFEHIQFFTPKTMTDLLEGEGFSVLETIPAGTDVPLMERFLKKSGVRPLLTKQWPWMRRFKPLRTALQSLYRRINRMHRPDSKDFGGFVAIARKKC